MTRIEREKKTVNNMIAMYCKKHHQPENGLCSDCASLVSYSNIRLDKCRFGNEKPICSKCPVHCYKEEMREKIKKVMRYAGPKMILYEPGLAIMHVADKFRNNGSFNGSKSTSTET